MTLVSPNAETELRCYNQKHTVQFAIEIGRKVLRCLTAKGLHPRVDDVCFATRSNSYGLVENGVRKIASPGYGSCWSFLR